MQLVDPNGFPSSHFIKIIHHPGWVCCLDPCREQSSSINTGRRDDIPTDSNLFQNKNFSGIDLSGANMKSTTGYMLPCISWHPWWWAKLCTFCRYFWQNNIFHTVPSPSCPPRTQCCNNTLHRTLDNISSRCIQRGKRCVTTWIWFYFWKTSISFSTRSPWGCSYSVVVL